MFRVGSALLMLVRAACAASTESVRAEEALVRRSSGPPPPYANQPFPNHLERGSSLIAPNGASWRATVDFGKADPHTQLDEVEAESAAIQDDPPSWPESWPAATTSAETRYPTFSWSGFLQVDSGWFLQDDASVEAIGHIGDRTGLRRVRLRAFGNIRRTSAYVVDLDFAASGHPSFRDVALSFHEIPFLQNVNFGYFQ